MKHKKKSYKQTIETKNIFSNKNKIIIKINFIIVKNAWSIELSPTLDYVPPAR